MSKLWITCEFIPDQLSLNDGSETFLRVNKVNIKPNLIYWTFIKICTSIIKNMNVICEDLMLE